MNTASTVRPEVAAFVEDVRARLADLSDDEREELLGGLEADLDEKVADGAPLGDPATYAAELRAAAGLPERTRRLPRLALPRPAHAERAMNASRARFLDLVAARPWVARAWEVVASLRPAWWVVRAWIAVTLLDVVTGPWEPISLLPSFNAPFVGWALLAPAIAISTLIGLGRLWPGSGPDRPLTSRVILLALNTVALIAPMTWGVSSPGYLTGSPGDGYGAGYRDGLNTPGLRVHGREVTNVFAYDAEGRPLEHVQLFDQQGRPLAVARWEVCPEWIGETRVFNVFPLTERKRDFGRCDVEDLLTPNHPLAAVPPVTSVPQEAVPAEGPDGKGDPGDRKGVDKGEQKGDRNGQS